MFPAILYTTGSILTSEGNWYVKDFPPPVGIKTSADFASTFIESTAVLVRRPYSSCELKTDQEPMNDLYFGRVVSIHSEALHVVLGEASLLKTTNIRPTTP